MAGILFHQNPICVKNFIPGIAIKHLKEKLPTFVLVIKADVRQKTL